jgi:hypothetical protein
MASRVMFANWFGYYVSVFTSLLNVCHYDIIGLGLLLLRQGLDLRGCFLEVVHVVSCPLAQIVL